MWDRRLLAEALMGPAGHANAAAALGAPAAGSDPLLARGGNHHKVVVRAAHIDSGEPIFYARKSQRAPSFKWLVGVGRE